MTTDWDSEILGFYQDMVADGFAITVRVPGSTGSFNPVTLEYDSDTDPTDTTTYAIRANYSNYEIDGTTVQASDSMLIFSSYGLVSELTSAHQILINSVVQEIVNIKKYAPANVILGYEVHIRG